MLDTSSGPVVIIPAYNPEQALVDICYELHKGYSIIVINDGSLDTYSNLFNEVSLLTNVHLLSHSENLGKGAALKTGFEFFIKNFRLSSGVVTADADGQHLTKDIKRVLECHNESPSFVVLGYRDFTNDIPVRSRFGNNVTRTVFKFASGVFLKDTQTGLRGLPREVVIDSLNIKSTAYDFELESLLNIAKSKRSFFEIPIETVYLDGNSTSHFNPILDSIKVYSIFLKFSIVGILSFLLDYTLFSIFYYLLGNEYYASFISRPISGVFNFSLNKSFVFSSKEKVQKEFLGYLLLFIIIFFMSPFLINTMHSYYGITPYLSKIFVDMFLFIFSYLIQRHVIFR